MADTAGSSFRMNVIAYPNTDSIDLVWDVVSVCDSPTIFVRKREPAREDEFKDALYHGFSLTDNIGCAMEAKALLSSSLDEAIGTLQKEFNVKSFLILDREGLLLPKEISRCLKAVRSRVSKDSHITYFPNDCFGMGMMNALYALRLEIDGLAGSVLGKGCELSGILDLRKLNHVYQARKRELFPKRFAGSLDAVFAALFEDGKGKERFKGEER